MIQDIVLFNILAIAVLLVITLVSAFLPLYLSTHDSWGSIFHTKFPYFTAGVFMGAGMLHLLPDSIEKYHDTLEKVIATSDTEWLTPKVQDILRQYPVIYLLSTFGAVLVWYIELINMGTPQKMMAVAASAEPGAGSSICKVQLPPVSTHAKRKRSQSTGSGLSAKRRDFYGACSSTASNPPGSSRALLSKISRAGAMKSLRNLLLKKDNVGHSTYSLDELIDEENDDDDNHNAEPNHDMPLSHHVVFTGENSVLPYLMAALFSLHSFIAGLTLGVNTELDKTAIATFMAIFSHKAIEAMSVGAHFVKENVGKQKSAAVITLYSSMTPLGIVVGMLLTHATSGNVPMFIESITMGIGSGSFIFLAFTEMSEEAPETTAACKTGLFLLGLCGMAALAYWL